VVVLALPTTATALRRRDNRYSSARNCRQIYN